jgi:hypothetical protein
VATPEELARQAEAIAAVRVARIERDKVVKQANMNLRAAILAALDAGASVRNVAVAAELTSQRIYQMINEDR